MTSTEYFDPTKQAAVVEVSKMFDKVLERAVELGVSANVLYTMFGYYQHHQLQCIIEIQEAKQAAKKAVEEHN